MYRSLPRPHDTMPCRTPRKFEASTSTPVEQSAGFLSSGRSFTVNGAPRAYQSLVSMGWAGGEVSNQYSCQKRDERSNATSDFLKVG